MILHVQIVEFLHSYPYQSPVQFSRPRIHQQAESHLPPFHTALTLSRPSLNTRRTKKKPSLRFISHQTKLSITTRIRKKRTPPSPTRPSHASPLPFNDCSSEPCWVYLCKKKDVSGAEISKVPPLPYAHTETHASRHMHPPHPPPSTSSSILRNPKKSRNLQSVTTLLPFLYPHP